MLDTYCRSLFQEKCVDPIVALLVKMPISPMSLTFSSVAFSLLFFTFVQLEYTALALVSLLLSGYCDVLDGSLARLLAQQSPKGAVLDVICDRLVEWVVLLALTSIDFSLRLLPSFVLLGSFYLCITSFLLVGIFSHTQSNKSFFYSVGIIERSETFLFFCLMLLFPAIFSILAYGLAVLVVLSAALRIHSFYRQFEANL